MDKPPLSSFLKSPIQKEDLEPEVSADAVIKRLKGAKGDKGDAGLNAEPPSIEELEALILPLIPDPIPGKNGQQGEIGFSGIDGRNGRDGVDGKDGKDATLTDITPKEVVEKINKSRGEKIKRSRVEGLDEVEGLARTAQRQVQNFISLGGSHNTRIGIPGGTVLTGVNQIDFLNGTITQLGDGTEIQYTAPSGGGGGSGYQAALTGGLTGTNTWATAPNALVIDGVVKQKTQTDGTVNWTGTTTTVLTGAQLPTFDIFAIG